MEWSKEKTLELIQFYKERPVLWDCTLADYKNKNKRHDALTEIAIHFQVEKVEIEKKN